DVPFEKLVEELSPERDLSRSPLFQVKLALQNAPREELRLGELLLRGMAAPAEMAKFELTLSLSQMGDESLEGRLEYAIDLLAAETIERMGGHWRQLMEGIVAHPEQRIDQLPLLSVSEREQLLVEWNNTRVEYPKTTVIGLFEMQVEQRPEAI